MTASAVSVDVSVAGPFAERPLEGAGAAAVHERPDGRVERALQCGGDQDPRSGSSDSRALGVSFECESEATFQSFLNSTPGRGR